MIAAKMEIHAPVKVASVRSLHSHNRRHHHHVVVRAVSVSKGPKPCHTCAAFEANTLGASYRSLLTSASRTIVPSSSSGQAPRAPLCPVMLGA